MWTFSGIIGWEVFQLKAEVTITLTFTKYKFPSTDPPIAADQSNRANRTLIVV